MFNEIQPGFMEAVKRTIPSGPTDVRHSMPGGKFGNSIQPQAPMINQMNQPLYSRVSAPMVSNADPNIIHPALMGAMTRPMGPYA